MLFDGRAKAHPDFQVPHDGVWVHGAPWFRWGEPSDGSGGYDRDNEEENRVGSAVETIAAKATWWFMREVGGFCSDLYQVRIA